jgi:hypothetical protein
MERGVIERIVAKLYILENKLESVLKSIKETLIKAQQKSFVLVSITVKAAKAIAEGMSLCGPLYTAVSCVPHMLWDLQSRSFAKIRFRT